MSSSLIGPPAQKVEIKTIELIKGIKIRLYRPIKGKTLAAVVYFHGGGWIIGSIKSYDRIMQYISYNSGCMVICIEYRKAPKYKFPVALNDALMAYEWVLDNAQQININKQCIAFVGDSAGANLAIALLSKINKEKLNLPLVMGLIYPVVDVSKNSINIMKKDKRWLVRKLGVAILNYSLGQYLNNVEESKSSSISLLKNLNKIKHPTTLVLTADIDPLTVITNKYIKILRSQGTKVISNYYAGTIHGFLNFNKISKSAKIALDDLVIFIRKNLHS